jgi:putative FmdB family regulatory protein
MPLYEYRCASCGELTEVLQRLGAAPPAECPRCGGTLERVASAPALQFKGSGWYVTDYAKRSGSDTSGKDETSGTAKPEGTSAKPESTSAKPEGTSADRDTKKKDTTKAG